MRIKLVALALLAAAPAHAQQTCANSPVPGFAPGQARMTDRLAPGAAVSLSLKPVEDVAFAAPLARKAVTGSFGGAFPLEVKIAAPYHFALSERLWIDVVRDGAALPSTDHQHGAPCSGVAKIVGYKLEPGHYTVQLSEGETRAVTVKVTREAVLPVAK